MSPEQPRLLRPESRTADSLTRAARPVTKVKAAAERSWRTAWTAGGRPAQFEAVRKRAALENEGEPPRRLHRAHVADDRLRAGDAERESSVGVVDVRRRLELVVKDDRVVLCVRLAELARGAVESGDELTARVFGLRDRLELLPPVAVEAERDLRRIRVRVGAGLDIRLVEVGAADLRRQFEEIPVRAVRRLLHRPRRGRLDRAGNDFVVC